MASAPKRAAPRQYSNASLNSTSSSSTVPSLAETDAGSVSSSCSHDGPIVEVKAEPITTPLLPDPLDIISLLSRVSTTDKSKRRRSRRSASCKQTNQKRVDFCEAIHIVHDVERVPKEESNRVWYNTREMMDMRRQALKVVDSLKQDANFLWGLNCLYPATTEPLSSAQQAVVSPPSEPCYSEDPSCTEDGDESQHAQELSEDVDHAYNCLAPFHDEARGLELHVSTLHCQHVQKQQSSSQQQNLCFLQLQQLPGLQQRHQRAVLQHKHPKAQRQASRAVTRATAVYALALAEWDAQEAAVAYCCD